MQHFSPNIARLRKSPFFGLPRPAPTSSRYARFLRLERTPVVAIKEIEIDLKDRPEAAEVGASLTTAAVHLLAQFCDKYVSVATHSADLCTTPQTDAGLFFSQYKVSDAASLKKTRTLVNHTYAATRARHRFFGLYSPSETEFNAMSYEAGTLVDLLVEQGTTPTVIPDLTTLVRLNWLWRAGRLLIKLRMHAALFDADQISNFANALSASVAKVVCADPLDLAEMSDAPGLATSVLRGAPRVLPFERLAEALDAAIVQYADAVAFSMGENTLSFSELGTEIARLIATFDAAGLRPGRIAVIHFPQSLEMMIAALACVKFGLVFAPPAVAQSEADVDLEQWRPEVTIGYNEAALSMEKSRCANVFYTLRGDISWSAPDAQSQSFQMPDGAVMVVATSGTTGNPTLVALPETGVINRLNWMWNAFPLVAEDRVAILKTPALVGFIWECFGGLLKGISSEVIAAAELIDPVRLSDRLIKGRITRITTSPQILTSLARYLEATRLKTHVRYLHISGDAVDESGRYLWNQAFPDAHIFNLYGATEFSSNVTLCDLSTAPDAFAVAPVGTPIDNFSVAILDDDGKPVPKAGIGELCIAGIGTYLRKSKVAPNDAKVQIAGEVLPFHRTGDRGCVTAAAGVVVAGRNDHQVKLRGYRVELQGIERVVNDCSEITACVAEIRRDDLGELLVLHYQSANVLDEKIITKQINSALPAYMHPDLFVWHPRIPVLASGKPDRQKLKRQQIDRFDCFKDFDPGKDDLIAFLCVVLAACLNLPSLAPGERFLDRNHNSLRLIQAQAILRERLNVNVSIAAFFQSPTVEHLAQTIQLRVTPTGGSEYQERAVKRRRAYSARNDVGKMQ